MTTSLISHPNRGPWGDAQWRGNLSGHVYKDLFEFFQPKTFVDPMVGSGTSIQVAKEMGIDAVGLDLHQGFDATRHSILDAVGRESQMVLSHPPYLDIVVYSGRQWGDAAVPGDLSHMSDLDEFLDALQAVMLNQRHATTVGGIYGTILGDVRRKGAYYSLQADLQARLPRNELRAVLIKSQHNTHGERKSYARMRWPMIMHEYILLYEKGTAQPYALLGRITKQNDRHIKGTWRALVRHALQKLGGNATLPQLYQAVAEGATQKLEANSHWQDKIRQTLQRYPDDFTNQARGAWALTAAA